MPYCTQPDIIGRISEETLIQLTDDDNLGVVDSALVELHAADAAELIDGYLRGRYTLPLETTPGIIKSLALDLTVYSLYSRRAEFETPKPVLERQQAALKILREIQSGVIALGAAGVETPSTVSGAGKVAAPERIFTKTVLDNY